MKSYKNLEKNVTTEMLLSAVEKIKDQYPLNPDELSRIIDGDPWLCFSIVSLGLDDTITKDQLNESLSEHFGGKRQITQPFLTAPRGTGKSYYAEHLRKENPNLTIIEIDIVSDIAEFAKPTSYSEMDKELTDNILIEASEALSLATGIILTADQILQLIDSDLDLCFSLVLNGANDTEVRGDLANALSLKLIHEEWPNNMQMEREIVTEEFFKRMDMAALSSGYTLLVDKTKFIGSLDSGE